MRRPKLKCGERERGQLSCDAMGLLLRKYDGGRGGVSRQSESSISGRAAVLQLVPLVPINWLVLKPWHLFFLAGRLDVMGGSPSIAGRFLCPSSLWGNVDQRSKGRPKMEIPQK